MRKKLVIGNWKMHGALRSNADLLEAVGAGVRSLAIDVAVCVPFPYLAQVSALCAESGLNWGAQTLSEHARGAYTGEVAASMLLEFGCRYVLVGHSERRAWQGESDSLVAAKADAAWQAGLVPVVCLGETLEEREAGATDEVVRRQFGAVARQLGGAGLRSAVIAYEPVWAIGTGLTASPAQAQAVHALLRAELEAVDPVLARETKILYGGSVKPANAGELFGCPDIDGGLIGGASLSAGDFVAICRAAAEVN